MIRGLAMATVVLGAAAPLHAGIPESVDPGTIPAYHVLAAEVAGGGQPRFSAIGQLREMGFRTVINIRTEGEGAVKEGEAVRAAGLAYLWVPVTPATFSLEDVDAVEKVLEDPEARPVLLHCASSNRVGGVWAVINARRGESLEEALKAGHEAGLHGPEMVEAVRRVLGAAPSASRVNP